MTQILQHHIITKILLKNLLINIRNWMKLNRLSININKTEYIVITNKKKKPNYQIKIDKNVITQTNCIKYLGVLIDESLSWKPQIYKLCSKLASGCWALYQLRTYEDSRTLLMVYYSFIQSHLNFCISSWGSSYATMLAPLIRL